MSGQSARAMNPPLDPFAQQFDSIEIDPARAPSAAAIERALSFAAPENAPGFYLLDDSGGRFEIDREFGVVSLRDEGILAHERGAVCTARLKVVEQSGASYEMDLRLRLTGRVPQVVGAEEFGLLAIDAPVETPTAAASEPRHTTHWTAYAPITAEHRAAPLGDEGAPFGTLLAPQMPCRAGGSAFLAVNESLPAPAPRNAHWTI